MKKILKIGLFFFVIYLLYLILSKIGLKLIYHRILRANVFFIFLAFLSLLFAHLIMNYRWKIIFDRITKVKFLKLLPYMFLGLFIGIITPSMRVGGEPIRAYYLSKRINVDKTKILATIILDKFFNILVYLFFVLFSLFYVIFFVGLPKIFDLIFELSFLGILFVMLFIFVFRKSLKIIYFEWFFALIYRVWFIKKKFDDYEHFKSYLHLKGRDFLRVFNESFDDKDILWKSLILSCVIWFFLYLTGYLLFLSFSYHISPLILFVVMSVSMFFGDVSLTPGGVAVTEGVAIIMYFFLSVNLVVATSVVLIERLLYYILGIGVGGSVFAYLHFKK